MPTRSVAADGDRMPGAPHRSAPDAAKDPGMALATAAPPNQLASSRLARNGANPWIWAGAGLAIESLALAGRQILGGPPGLEPFQLTLAWLAIVVVGAGVVIRFQQHEEAGQAPAALVRRLLTLIFGLLAIGLTGMLLASWSGVAALHRFGLRPGLATAVWGLTAPVSAAAAWQRFRALQSPKPLTRLEEAAVLLLVLALTGHMAGFALPADWNTLRHFLGIVGWVALFGASFAAVEQRVRRRAVSALILFHFGGIITATLAIPPNPWLFSQIWMRIYRPYLEFMYLNNAYHFYSPEPGPACYLWFRLYFKDAEGKDQAEWYKIPRLDENGRHHHGVALIYQRTISLTENTQLPAQIALDSPEYQARLAARLKHTPEAVEKEGIIGQRQVRLEDTVPMYQGVPHAQQLKAPTPDTKKLVSSYVRHVAYKADELYPDWKLQKMRVYRVIHAIPSRYLYLEERMNPNDPGFYYPYYFGEYDLDGHLLDAKDPFLYWLLPIQREENNKFAPIKDWARKHAGDRAWIGWVDEQGKQQWGERDPRRR